MKHTKPGTIVEIDGHQYITTKAVNGCVGCAFNSPPKRHICPTTPYCGSYENPPMIIYKEIKDEQ